MKNGRKIFIPELNTFGIAFDVQLVVKNKNGSDGFADWVKTIDVETLERLKKTQVENENFMSADVIYKELESRKTKT